MNIRNFSKILLKVVKPYRALITLILIVIIYLLPVGEKPEFISYNGQIVEVSQTKPILQSIYPQGVYATCGDGGTGTNCHTGCCSAGACVVCPPQPDDEPPIINASVNCSQTGSNGWCIGSLTLDLSASDPQGQAILISGTLNGIPFTCPTATCSIPITTEGTGTITYRVDSATGLSANGLDSYKLDISTPQLNGSVSGVIGNNNWYRSNAILTITSNDSISGIASVTTTINGGIQTPYTSPISFADGTYSVLITATDHAGNSTQITQTIQVDTINPSINASLNGKNGKSGWYVSNVDIAPTTSDSISGIASFELSIDSGAWTNNSTPFTISNGNHTYQLRATDNAGNSTTTPIQTIKVDTIAPFIDITAEVDLGNTIYYELQDPSTSSGQAGSGLAVYRAVIEDEDERYQKIVWLEEISGNKLSDQILWDGKFKDGTQAGIGDYFITLKISDVAGNERMKTAIVHVNLFSFLQEITTFTPPQTNPNLQLEDVQPFDNAQDETETIAPSTSFGGETVFFADGDFVTGSFGVASSTNPITNIPLDPSILWGATAAAVLGYTLAEWEKQREEERKRKEAEEAAAEKHKNTEKRKDQKEAEDAVRERWAAEASKVQNQPKAGSDVTEVERLEAYQQTAQYQNYWNNLVRWDEEKKKEEEIVRRATEADMTEQEKLAAYQQTEQYQQYQASLVAWQKEQVKEEAQEVKDLMCDTTDYPLPLKPPEVDYFDLSCEVADAIDPRSPSLEPAGLGDLIDQAAISFSQTPRTPYMPFEVARHTVFAMKFFKDRISTGYNIACQAINEEGAYYDIAVKIKEDVIEQWAQLSSPQKAFVAGYAIIGVLVIVVPLVLFTLL